MPAYIKFVAVTFTKTAGSREKNFVPREDKNHSFISTKLLVAKTARELWSG